MPEKNRLRLRLRLEVCEWLRKPCWKWWLKSERCVFIEQLPRISKALKTGRLRNHSFLELRLSCHPRTWLSSTYDIYIYVNNLFYWSNKVSECLFLVVSLTTLHLLYTQRSLWLQKLFEYASGKVSHVTLQCEHINYHQKYLFVRL